MILCVFVVLQLACAHGPEVVADPLCVAAQDGTVERLRTDLRTLEEFGTQDLQLAALASDFSTFVDEYSAAGRDACVASGEVAVARRACLARGAEIADQLRPDLADEDDAMLLSYTVDTRLAQLEASLWCDERARRLGQSDPRGASFAAGGVFLSDGASGPVQLSASLVCQRQDGSPVPDCDGATLRRGDRFKVAFHTDVPATVYVFLSNSTGQFQTLFPSDAVSNETQPGVRYVLPPGDNWFTLDGTAGVLEHVQVVAAAGAIEDLELLRGADLPPVRKFRMEPKARRARALLEPLVFRGVEPVPGDVLLVGETETPTREAIVSRPDAVAVEFRIRHE